MAIVYWRVVGVFFAVDDFGFLMQAAIPVPGPAEIVARRYLSSAWLFHVCSQIFGTDPRGFHLVTLTLHLLNAELLYQVVRRLLDDDPVAIVASFAFAIHPAAYTSVAWIAAGFNEVPVQTLSLASLFLLLSDWQQRARWWKPVAAAGCAMVAAGFKQNAILIPLYWSAALAFLAIERRLPERRWHRLAIPFVLVAPFYVFFSWRVLPLMRTIFSGPYEQSFEPRSLGVTGLRLIAAAFNPLPVVRESLGSRLAGVGPEITPWLGTILGLACAVVASTIAMLAPRVRRHSAWVIISGPLLVGLIAVPASMPWHVYEYYLYLSLPVAAIVMALALVGTLARVGALDSWAQRRRELRTPTRTRMADFSLAALILLALWLHGWSLHATSDIVAEADRAQAIDRFVARLPDHTHIVVVPPSDQAHHDTTFGLSVKARHGRRGVDIVFAAPGEPPPTIGAQSRQLLAIARRDNRRMDIALVDNAQWQEGRERAALTPEQPIAEQPFRVEGPDFAGLQIRATALGHDTCVLHYEITEEERDEKIGQGTIACREAARTPYVTLPVASRAASQGRRYLLRLRVDARDAMISLATGPARSPETALRRDGHRTDFELTYRVITAPPM